MSELNKMSDEDLIALLQKGGNNQGYAILYHRYAHLMLGWCLRYLKDEQASEDAVMDVMEQLINNLHRYAINDFKNWLFLVVRNHCFQKLRKTTRILMDDIAQIEEEVVESEGKDHLIYEMREQALHEGVQQLKPAQRECITLFYFQQLSYKEIEQQTAYNLKQVKSNIQNGKRNLKIYMNLKPFDK